MRRLPVYLLLDTSGYINGEPLEAVKNGVQVMINYLRQNPQAIETIYLSINTLSESQKELMPLEELSTLRVPKLEPSNYSYLGNALNLVSNNIDNKVIKSTELRKGDWIPIVVILLAGEPQDNWLPSLAEYKKRKHKTTVLRISKGISSKTAAAISENVIDTETDSNKIINSVFGWWSDTDLPVQQEEIKDKKEYIRMRRLPVYFLLDTSGSMFGEPIQALNNALSGMVNTLRTDAQALDSLWLSIITFDRDIKEIVPLTELVSFQLPEITCPQSGPTHTGKALELLHEKVIKEVRKGSSEQKGDWKPLLFLFTDGKPSDLQLYREMIPKIKSLNFGAIVACAAGHLADDTMLKELTDTVIHLDTADSSTLKTFFKWVSDTIEQGNKSMGTQESVALPPPPSEITLVI